jgi:hypothetical protein
MKRWHSTIGLTQDDLTLASLQELFNLADGGA